MFNSQLFLHSNLLAPAGSLEVTLSVVCVCVSFVIFSLNHHSSSLQAVKECISSSYLLAFKAHYKRAFIENIEYIDYTVSYLVFFQDTESSAGNAEVTEIQSAPTLLTTPPSRSRTAWPRRRRSTCLASRPQCAGRFGRKVRTIEHNSDLRYTHEYIQKQVSGEWIFTCQVKLGLIL